MDARKDAVTVYVKEKNDLLRRIVEVEVKLQAALDFKRRIGIEFVMTQVWRCETARETDM